ncbi:MAG: S41 family peptidase [Gemmatimonadaceae bacterium]
MRYSRLLSVASLTVVAPLSGQSLDGVWKTQGYGLILRVKGQDLTAWEVTSTTCLDSFEATRDTSAAVAGREATFSTKDGSVFFVRAGGSRDHRRMHSDGAASDMLIDRVDVVPARCTPPTTDTPQNNFDVFSRTWAEHYILFDEKHVDWDALVATNRARITDTTSATTLFDVMSAMIKPLDDAHTFISAPSIKRQFRALRSGTDRVINANGGPAGFRKEGLPKLLGVVDQHYLSGPVRSWCNDQVQYGHLNDSTGYLRITSFSGFAKGGFADGLRALEAGLDTIFTDSRLKGLVIDVRINFGGADPYGLAIASRLTTSEYLAYSKEARADPVDRTKWTPGDRSTVRPSSRPSFHGPVVELTSGLTISAGETFTQALMGRLPHVTRIGENTQGVFSDVLGREMPNGWHFGLPNEVFRTKDGKTFDGAGIPPDIAVPVFVDADVTAGRDPAVQRALEVLWSRR